VIFSCVGQGAGSRLRGGDKKQRGEDGGADFVIPACSLVIPAKAGIQSLCDFLLCQAERWTPAYAGVTKSSAGATSVVFLLFLLSSLSFPRKRESRVFVIFSCVGQRAGPPPARGWQKAARGRHRWFFCDSCFLLCHSRESGNPGSLWFSPVSGRALDPRLRGGDKKQRGGDIGGFFVIPAFFFVIPAKAGIQGLCDFLLCRAGRWTPACAGVTDGGL